ncbi:MAG: hypothetical protein DRG78_16695 [Epsilonproteobacteria bacterium]|nr:MAG: hypothetical protein DRG78_16695 [Campylobacterota bacterium]
MKNIFLSLTFISFIWASNCSPYYNPNRFIEASDALDELFIKYKVNNNIKKFNIVKKELYQYIDEEIAGEINDSFGYLWNDWIEDGYEMQLSPEQTLIHYNGHYLSLEVFIYGIKGDATKLNKTEVKYSFYNYTNEVHKYIKCKESEK